jgi:predicted ATPase/DNA-binding SARP family transcriptional activator
VPIETVHIELGMLGPVRALRGGVPVPLGGPRQRAVLARLLLEPGRVVGFDTLVADVWDDDAPPTAAKVLQKYVSELRSRLGAPSLVTDANGYRLDVPGDAVDTRRFEQLLATGDADGALALWRGEALAGLPDLHFVTVERARLHELRTVAHERSVEAALRAGRAAEVAVRAAELVARHPLRAKPCELLMRALYRAGRQAEALEVFAEHRRRLADELGIDPAEELAALEAAVLRHDPALGPTGGRPAAGTGGPAPPPSTFLGRDADLQRVRTALRTHPLVTLTGPGGVGKTRLAVESMSAARGEAPGGCCFVDLAAVADPALVPHTVARALGLAEQAGQDDEQTVLAALPHRPGIVLVLDNCEHLAPACALLVDRVVRAAPRVRVLATSRRPLGVDGERVLPVAPLADDDAVRLLADRAGRAGVPDDEVGAPALADLARRLDGLPLALELVAGQLRTLGPAALTARLDDRLGFVTRRFDAPGRQRTLRDVVAWSYGLLPPATQRFFSRLGVFATTFTLDAAGAVGGEPDPLDHLSVLVEHSLLARESPGAAPPGDDRYRLLDTLRLFALDRLRDTGELDAARRAHADFYRALAEQAGPHLHGPAEDRWSARLAVEEPNLHLALAWAHERDPALALELGLAMWPYWEVRWRERFAVDYLVGPLETAEVDDDRRAWALTEAADLASNQGEARLSGQWARRAAAHFRRTGNRDGLARALLAVASACGNAGALDEADDAVAEALGLARELGDGLMVGHGLNFASFVATRRGDHRRAAELSRAELAAWRAVGSRRGEATALRHLAVALRYLGDLDQAAALCERGLAVWAEIGDLAAAAHVQLTFGDLARLRGDAGEAEARYEQALDELRRIGDRRCTASLHRNLAVLATAAGDHARSTALLQEAIRLRIELGDSAGLPECFEAVALNLASTGRAAEAQELLRAAQRQRAATRASPSPEDERTRAGVAALIGPAVPGPRPAFDDAVGFVLGLSSGPE